MRTIFVVMVKNEISKPRIIAICGSEISDKTRVLFVLKRGGNFVSDVV
jgi:hypothetical protein